MAEPPPPHEIERRYLLDRLPPLPPDAEATVIEQGYLPEAADEQAPTCDADGGPRRGRLRRRRDASGREHFTHTVKAGAGLVRQEWERTIDRAAFEAAWPRTSGRRLAKTRHTVAGPDGLRWEIDVFDDMPLVLAEVELPAEDAEPRIPDWLRDRIVREVTDEPAYTNARLAIDGPPPGLPPLRTEG
jgi:adenylate cyclase